MRIAKIVLVILLVAGLLALGVWVYQSGFSFSSFFKTEPEENMTTYNSRRDKYTIEELIVKAEGVVDMDLERFAKIGRVMDEWNLD